jgi:hypothetical protein
LVLFSIISPRRGFCKTCRAFCPRGHVVEPRICGGVWKEEET